jgi:hypothetical protein
MKRHTSKKLATIDNNQLAKVFGGQAIPNGVLPDYARPYDYEYYSYDGYDSAYRPSYNQQSIGSWFSWF